MISGRVDLTDNMQFSRELIDFGDSAYSFIGRKYPWSVDIHDYDNEYSQSDSEVESGMVLTGSKKDREFKIEYRNDYLYHCRCERCGEFLDKTPWRELDRFIDLCRKCSDSLNREYGEVEVDSYKKILIYDRKERNSLYTRYADMLF